MKWLINHKGTLTVVHSFAGKWIFDWSMICKSIWAKRNSNI